MKRTIYIALSGMREEEFKEFNTAYSKNDLMEMTRLIYNHLKHAGDNRDCIIIDPVLAIDEPTEKLYANSDPYEDSEPLDDGDNDLRGYPNFVKATRDLDSVMMEVTNNKNKIQIFTDEMTADDAKRFSQMGDISFTESAMFKKELKKLKEARKL